MNFKLFLQHWQERRKRLTKEQASILQRLGEGWTLKSHRYLDGRKQYQLHSLEGEVQEVNSPRVEELMEKGYIYPNHKFPAGTYLLTEKGQKAATQLTENKETPLGTKNYFS